jgi:energy-coupling factor transporter ATP-binding protein EcfA2
MSVEVTGVIGLSGSGKTHLVDQMNGVRIFQESFLAHKDEFFAALKAGANCVVSERALLREEVREHFVREILEVVPDAKIKWVCFANDLEKANRNCRRARSDKKPGSEEAHVRMNEIDSKTYTIPDGAETLPIWSEDEIK